MRRTFISSGSTCIQKSWCSSTTKIRFLAASLNVDLQGQIPHQRNVFPYVDTFSIHMFSETPAATYLSEHIRIPSWCHDDNDNTDKFRADSNDHCVNLGLLHVGETGLLPFYCAAPLTARGVSDLHHVVVHFEANLAHAHRMPDLSHPESPRSPHHDDRRTVSQNHGCSVSRLSTCCKLSTCKTTWNDSALMEGWSAHGFADHKENTTLKNLDMRWNELGEKGNPALNKCLEVFSWDKSVLNTFDMRDSTDDCWFEV